MVRDLLQHLHSSKDERSDGIRESPIRDIEPASNFRAISILFDELSGLEGYIEQRSEIKKLILLWEYNYGEMMGIREASNGTPTVDISQQGTVFFFITQRHARHEDQVIELCLYVGRVEGEKRIYLQRSSSVLNADSGQPEDRWSIDEIISLTFKDGSPVSGSNKQIHVGDIVTAGGLTTAHVLAVGTFIAKGKATQVGVI
jgi:hypothetical protein